MTLIEALREDAKRTQKRIRTKRQFDYFPEMQLVTMRAFLGFICVTYAKRGQYGSRNKYWRIHGIRHHDDIFCDNLAEVQLVLAFEHSISSLKGWNPSEPVFRREYLNDFSS